MNAKMGHGQRVHALLKSGTEIGHTRCGLVCLFLLPRAMFPDRKTDEAVTCKRCLRSLARSPRIQ